jgi:hypothetical protein
VTLTAALGAGYNAQLWGTSATVPKLQLSADI